MKLGTTYPRHTFAVNPAPVSGTLSTQDAGNISITAADGLETECPFPIETKFLDYSTGYNYYSPAPHSYTRTQYYLARTEVSGTKVSFSQPITFEADADHVLQFEFLEKENNYYPKQDEFFVITIFFENGETGLYFVSPK